MNADRDTYALRGGLRWFRWRGLLLAVIFLLGLTAFCGGAEVSERDVQATDFMSKVYYSLGLFVLGGMDLGMPTGGPVWSQAILWVVYFAAPAITTSAVVEAVLYAVRPGYYRMRHLRNHVIIIGCGRLAMLYLERLRAVEPGTRVLIVDKRTDNPHAHAAIERFHARVLNADVASRPTLQALRLKHARRLAVLTGDDYINLDTAATAIQLAPHLATETLVHISDLRLLRVMEDSELLQQAAKFNTYRRAAQYLVTEKLLPHFVRTEAADIVVLAGFGRFGQSLLDQLQESAAGKFGRVIIIDREGDLQTRVFDEQVGFQNGYEWELMTDNLQHPGTWKHVAEKIKAAATEPVFVLGSGNDSVNIRTALGLAHSYPHAKIVARCFRHSTFAEHISGECDFEIVSTADLLLSGMLPEWFGEVRSH